MALADRLTVVLYRVAATFGDGLTKASRGGGGLGRFAVLRGSACARPSDESSRRRLLAEL